MRKRLKKKNRIIIYLEIRISNQLRMFVLAISTLMQPIANALTRVTVSGLLFRGWDKKG